MVSLFFEYKPSSSSEDDEGEKVIELMMYRN